MIGSISEKWGLRAVTALVAAVAVTAMGLQNFGLNFGSKATHCKQRFPPWESCEPADGWTDAGIPRDPSGTLGTSEPYLLPNLRNSKIFFQNVLGPFCAKPSRNFLKYWYSDRIHILPHASRPECKKRIISSKSEDFLCCYSRLQGSIGPLLGVWWWLQLKEKNWIVPKRNCEKELGLRNEIEFFSSLKLQPIDQTKLPWRKNQAPCENKWISRNKSSFRIFLQIWKIQNKIL